ncbi:MAG: glycosyl hydrolase family 8 [Solirubrobacteraceae bacterium]
MRRRPLLILIAVAALLAGAATGALRGQGHTSDPTHAAVDRFMERYVEGDGRVVRRDQGGDTVSEGQAYAMLMTAATGDRGGFDRVWGWTQRHLQRPDGLLAWRPGGGQQPAADADLDAARALLVAGRRFGDASYTRAAHRLGAAIAAGETTTVGGRRVLVAGPWARAQQIVNPSYDAPRTFALLGLDDLRASAVAGVHALQAHRSGLAPDWAKAAPGGATPIGDPQKPADQARFSFDAARIPIRLAEDCDPAVGREAAAPWPSLRAHLAPARDLGNAPLAGGSHPVIAIAAAASAAAAGDQDAARTLLDRAADLDRQSPTYYGAAWVALGRIMLTTDWLWGCPPIRST